MKNKILLYLFASIIIISCDENPNYTPIDDSFQPDHKGFFLLSKGSGSWGASSSLALFDKQTNKMTVNYYKSINNEDLGRDATDILIYGSKFYVISSGVNKMIIGDVLSGKKIEEVDFGQIEDETNLVTPRKMISGEGNIYVSTHMDGIKIIDTLLFETRTVALSGSFSEDIVKHKNMIYVVNSGEKGMYYPGEGKTLSIVDLKLEKEIGVIDVPLNPNRLAITEKGELYLSTWGNFDDMDASVHKINFINNKFETIPNVIASRIAVSKRYLYALSVGFITGEKILTRVNISNNSVENISQVMKIGENNIGIGEIFYDNLKDQLYMLSDETGYVIVIDESLNLIRTHRVFAKYENGIEMAVTNLNKIEFINL